VESCCPGALRVRSRNLGDLRLGKEANHTAVLTALVHTFPDFPPSVCALSTRFHGSSKAHHLRRQPGCAGWHRGGGRPRIADCA
jgi:hypothetical protein